MNSVRKGELTLMANGFRYVYHSVNAFCRAGPVYLFTTVSGYGVAFVIYSIHSRLSGLLGVYNTSDFMVICTRPPRMPG